MLIKSSNSPKINANVIPIQRDIAKEGGVEGVLQGVLGGGSASQSEGATADGDSGEEKQDPKDMLKGLFGN